MKTNKVLYWIFTGLICLWMAFQGVMFIIGPDNFSALFEGLGFPAALIMPLGVAKLLAAAAIISDKSVMLKRAAYAGLAVDFIVALVAHLMAGDGQFGGAAVALVLLGGSYIFDKKRKS